MKRFIIGALAVFVLFVGIALRPWVTVPAGHVAVATLFGDPQEGVYNPGLTFPVNPLYSFEYYDARQKTLYEELQIPSRDQLQTDVDVSVQYRIIGTMASEILSETGTQDKAVEVHLIPKLRSVLREQGKGVARAEDFFQEETVELMQDRVYSELKEYLQPEGILVDAVLFRQIELPSFITKAIEAKKEREQAVERQKAELARFETEQQQKIAQAEAEKTAALEAAEKIKTLADAEAYQIAAINKAIADNPAYIKLKALETLGNISKDPSSKIYFLNGDSSTPLPLMHIGDSAPLTEGKLNMFNKK